MQNHPSTAEFAKLTDEQRASALAQLRAIVEFMLSHRLRQAQQIRHCDRLTVEQLAGHNASHLFQ